VTETPGDACLSSSGVSICTFVLVKQLNCVVKIYEYRSD
jgi:hypothetical protein